MFPDAYNNSHYHNSIEVINSVLLWEYNWKSNNSDFKNKALFRINKLEWLHAKQGELISLSLLK